MKKFGLVLVALVVTIFLAGCQEWGLSFGETIDSSEFVPENGGINTSLCNWIFNSGVQVSAGEQVVILKIQPKDAITGDEWSLVIAQERLGWIPTWNIEFWGESLRPSGRPCPAPRRPLPTPEINVLEDPN